MMPSGSWWPPSGLALVVCGLTMLAVLAVGGVAISVFQRRRIPVDDDKREQVTGKPDPADIRRKVDRAPVDAPANPPQEWDAGHPGQSADGYALIRLPDLSGRQRTVGVSDSGVHALPQPTRGLRVGCHECDGRGFVVKPVKELLRESLALIPEGQGDAVVTEFYRRVLAADKGKAPADRLVSLFPADLVSASAGMSESRGVQQRDKLFKTLVALADLYNPDDPAAIERLDNALRAYGRSHALFLRPDGSVRGATLQEYAQVQSVLLGTFHDLTAAAWRSEYDMAWIEAYDHAAPVMMAEAHRAILAGEVTVPREPRPHGDVRLRGGDGSGDYQRESEGVGERR
jgi:hemoglobin-like flavoprotein